LERFGPASHEVEVHQALPAHKAGVDNIDAPSQAAESGIKVRIDGIEGSASLPGTRLVQQLADPPDTLDLQRFHPLGFLPDPSSAIVCCDARFTLLSRQCVACVVQFAQAIADQAVLTMGTIRVEASHLQARIPNVADDGNRRASTPGYRIDVEVTADCNRDLLSFGRGVDEEERRTISNHGFVGRVGPQEPVSIESELLGRMAKEPDIDNSLRAVRVVASLPGFWRQRAVLNLERDSGAIGSTQEHISPPLTLLIRILLPRNGRVRVLAAEPRLHKGASLRMKDRLRRVSTG